MAKKQQQHEQTDAAGELFTPRGEREWWMDYARQFACEHFLPEFAEQCFKLGLTPRKAADLMKEK